MDGTEQCVGCGERFEEGSDRLFECEMCQFLSCEDCMIVYDGIFTYCDETCYAEAMESKVPLRAER